MAAASSLINISGRGDITGDLTGTADDADKANVIATTESSNAKVDGTVTATEIRSISQDDYDDLTNTEKADILWLITS